MLFLRKLQLIYIGVVAVIATIVVCVIHGIYGVMSRDNIIQNVTSEVGNRLKGICF